MFFAFALGRANAMPRGGTLRRNWEPSATASTAVATPESPLGMQAGSHADRTKNCGKSSQNSMLWAIWAFAL